MSLLTDILWGDVFLDTVRKLNDIMPSPQATAAGKVQRVTKLSDELEKVYALLAMLFHRIHVAKCPMGMVCV